MPEAGAWLKQRRMKTGFALAAMLLAAACGDSGQATQEAFAEADARAAEDGRISTAVRMKLIGP